MHPGRGEGGHMLVAACGVSYRSGDGLWVDSTGWMWWSDWGSPDRIVQTLTRFGAEPALIAEQLQAAAAEGWSGAPLSHGEAMKRQFD